MTITILADVIDIRHDTPGPSDRFLVDTNIWYQMAYLPQTKNPLARDTPEYGYYIGQCIHHDSALAYYALSLPELSHSIERNEWQATVRDTNRPNLSFKHFRRNYRAARQQTLDLIDETWTVVQKLCGDNCLSILADETLALPFLHTFGATAIDGYDVLMLHAMQNAALHQVITDDADFGQVAGLQVFSANAYLLEQAQQQGRLVRRGSL